MSARIARLQQLLERRESELERLTLENDAASRNLEPASEQGGARLLGKALVLAACFVGAYVVMAMGPRTAPPRFLGATIERGRSSMCGFCGTPSPPVPALSIHFPPGSEHAFGEPLACAEAKTRTLDPQWKDGVINAFVELDPNASCSACWQSIAFRPPGEDAFTKERTWDPQRRLRTEIDRAGNDVYLRRIDEQGRTYLYQHRRGPGPFPKWIGGVSLDVTGAEVARIENGAGEEIDDGAWPYHVEHVWVADGEAFLFETIAHKRVVRATLVLGEDRMTFDWTGDVPTMTTSDSLEGRQARMDFPQRFWLRLAQLGKSPKDVGLLLDLGRP